MSRVICIAYDYNRGKKGGEEGGIGRGEGEAKEWGRPLSLEPAYLALNPGATTLLCDLSESDFPWFSLLIGYWWW